ncbi:MAG: acyloxyacyl hydrolase [PVC group bacterium]|nr:acyloxyacyl hydrolase [PVC group bacterium]
MSKHRLIYFLIFLLYIPLAFAGPTESSPQKDTIFVTKGSHFWSLTIGGCEDKEKDLAEITHAHFIISNYIRDDLALTYGIGLGYANPVETKKGFQGGPNIGLRMHFINSKLWSIYMDSSLGMVYHQYPIEEDSLYFNFEIQGGFGAAYRINEKAILLLGYRHYHLSNANIGGENRNPGYDGPKFYFGFMNSF